MKTFLRKKLFGAFTLVEVLIVIVIVAILALVIPWQKANAAATGASTQPTFKVAQSNWTGLVNTNAHLTSFTTDTNQFVTIRPHTGLGVTWCFHATGSTSSNQTLYLNLLGDGTNWTGRGGATDALSLSAAANGTNRMCYFFSISPTNFENAQAIGATSWSNSSSGAGVVTDSLVFSWDNQ